MTDPDDVYAFAERASVHFQGAADGHQCDGETQWCNRCEAREKAKSAIVFAYNQGWAAARAHFVQLLRKDMVTWDDGDRYKMGIAYAAVAIDQDRT